MIVDAHGDEIDADRVVNAAFDRDLDLGADAVIGGDQDGIDEAGRFQIEQAAKPADFRIGARAARRANERLDPLDHGIARVDVDAGFGIGQRRSEAFRSWRSDEGGSGASRVTDLADERARAEAAPRFCERLPRGDINRLC